MMRALSKLVATTAAVGLGVGLSAAPAGAFVPLPVDVLDNVVAVDGFMDGTNPTEAVNLQDATGSVESLTEGVSSDLVEDLLGDGLGPVEDLLGAADTSVVDNVVEQPAPAPMPTPIDADPLGVLGDQNPLDLLSGLPVLL